MTAKRPNVAERRARDLANEMAYAQALIAYRVAISKCDPFPPGLRAMLSPRGVNVERVARDALADVQTALRRLGDANVERVRVIERGERQPAPRKRALVVVPTQA